MGGMVGLRDVFVASPIISDAHGASLGVGLGVFPLLAAAPQSFPATTATTMDGSANTGIHQDNRSGAGTGNSTGFHLWQNRSDFTTGGSRDVAGIGIGVGSLSGTTTTCQDCGNQAKKDCSHRRCRTCCKSRGFDCSTHVKSTWVPAARRRERLMVAGSSSAAGTAGCSSGSTSGAKKPRLVASQATTTSRTSTSNTPPRSFDSSSSHQDASFKETLPGQVRAPAVFKCVRVTAVDDGEDEFAYQAVVKIGGHVFKGFLYDQGVDHQEQEHDHEERGGSLFPNISELHLGNSRIGAGGGTSNILDPYVASGGAPSSFLAPGSTFGGQIN